MDAIVQNFLNAWNSQDASNIGSFMVSDFERWNNGKKIVSGLEEMQNFMNGNFAMSSDAKVTLSDQDHVGNKIYVKWNYSGINSGELADGSPATMEEVNVHIMLSSGGSEPLLCFIDLPSAAENSAIFIAVAVAQHHFLALISASFNTFPGQLML